MRPSLLLAALAAGVVVLVVALGLTEAHAQGVGAVVNTIPETFQSRIQPIVGPVRSAALNLFAFICTIGICFALYEQIMGGGGLADILRTILRQGIMVGFWYWLLVNGGFFHDVINGVATVANNASTAAGGSRNLSPGDMAAVGVNIVRVLWEATTARAPVTSAILVICGLSVLIAFVYITGRMIEVLVESYIFAVIVVFVLAFGGSAFTREFAIGALRLSLAIGLKRFILQLLVAVGESLMIGWANDLANKPTEVTAMISIIFCSGMMWMLCMKLPQRVGDVLSGSYSGGYGSGLMGTVKSAIQTASKAGAAAAGAGVATAAAYKLASSQLGQSAPAGSAPGRAAQGAGRAAQLTMMTVRNAGQAAASDVGRRLTGNYATQHGSMPWRMATDMKRRQGAVEAAKKNDRD